MFDTAQILVRTSVNHLEFHRELPSTSDLARELAEELTELSPALVLTAEQTGGRGRGGNTWWAGRGALTFTLVLRSEDLSLPADRQPMISLAAGAAVRHVLADHVSTPVQIKWPNDVVIGNQKVCGILTEQRPTAAGTAVLIGIGINVNNSLSVAPDDVRQRATSLFDLTGQSQSLDELLIQILNSIDQSVARLGASASELSAILNTHHALAGRVVEIESGDGVFTGVCQGIDETGALILRIDNSTRSFVSGSIVRW